MGLFSRKPRTRDTSAWTPARIELLDATRRSDHEGPESGEYTTLDFVIDAVADRGGTPYHFVLRVNPAAGAPYQIEHDDTVPNSVTGQGLFASGKKIPAGIELAGWADPSDPAKVRIDWSSYAATPESKAEVEDAAQAENDRIYAEHVLAKQKPKMQEQLRSSAWLGTWSNAQGVAAGQVDYATWERNARANVRRTLITPEQYEQARAVADPTHPPA